MDEPQRQLRCVFPKLSPQARKENRRAPSQRLVQSCIVSYLAGIWPQVSWAWRSRTTSLRRLGRVDEEKVPEMNAGNPTLLGLAHGSVSS